MRSTATDSRCDESARTEPAGYAVTGTNVPPPLLPSHIEETIRLIARLHAEHHQSATPLQRAVDRMTALLGHPRFIGALTVIVAGWISLNLLAAALSYHPIDPPPFSWLG